MPTNKEEVEKQLHIRRGASELQLDMKAFARAMVEFFGSPTNKERLIEIIQEAKKVYDKPKGYTVLNAIYYFTRGRDSDFETLLSQFNHDDQYIWFHGLLEFMQKGGWDKGSANEHLFKRLVKQITNYDEASINYLLSEKFTAVAEAFKNELSTQILNYKNANQLIKERREQLEQERNRVSQREVTQSNSVSLIVLDSGQQLSKEYRADSTFTVSLQAETIDEKIVHNLYWHDRPGHKELISHRYNDDAGDLIAQCDKKGGASLNAIQQRTLKLFAQSEIITKLNTLHVELGDGAERCVNSFSLVKKAENWQLAWYDLSGAKHVLALDDHPQIDRFLQELEYEKASELKNHELQILKILLRAFKPPVPQVEEKKKSKVRDVLQKREGITLVCASQLLKDDSRKLNVRPYKIRQGTYYLTKEPIENTILEQQKGLLLKDDAWLLLKRVGKNFEIIDMSDWSEMYDVLEGECLKSVEHLTPETISLTAVNKLRSIIKENHQEKARFAVTLKTTDDLETVVASPDSYCLYKKDDAWAIRYFDTLGKGQDVNVEEVYTDDKQLLKAQLDSLDDCNPSELSPQALQAISVLLVGVKPVSKLNIDSFALINQALSKSPKPVDVKKLETKPSEVPLVEQSPKASNKLKMADFQHLESLFGKAAKNEVKVTSSDKVTRFTVSSDMKSKHALLSSLLSKKEPTDALMPLPQTKL